MLIVQILNAYLGGKYNDGRFSLCKLFGFCLKPSVCV